MKHDNYKKVIEIRSLGKIELVHLEKALGKITTDKIVIMKERERHIRERHPEDFLLFEQYGYETIHHPDIILKDSKNIGTIFLIKRIGDNNLNVIVRVVLATDNQEYKNSVMTFYRIRDKNLQKLIRKTEVIYKKS